VALRGAKTGSIGARERDVNEIMKRIYLRRLYTLSAVAVLLLAGLAGCRRTEGLGEMTPDGYLPAKENLMVGIKIYFGSEREYIGEMLGRER
jgi:hypothetical protein